MIKIKVKSDTPKKNLINEIDVNTPQYQETYKLTAEEKTALNLIFDNKKRVVLKADLKPPSLIDSVDSNAEIADYIIDNSYDSLKNYSKMDEPPRNEIERQRKEKYKQDGVARLVQKVIFDITSNIREETKNKKLKDPNARDLTEQEEERLVKDAVVDSFRQALESSIYHFLNDVKIDLGTRRVSGRNDIQNPKSPTGMSPPKSIGLDLFMDMHEAAVKEMESYYDSISADVPRAMDITDIIRYREDKGLPPLPEKSQAFIDVYKRISNEDVRSYQVNQLLSHGARDRFLTKNITIKYSEFVNLAYSLIKRFGYDRMTNKVSKNMTLVLTRIPLEIVRMSDLPQLHSCHMVGGMYASCATQEAKSAGGAVGFLFPQSYNEAKIKRLETNEREFIIDLERNIKGSNPLTRIRMRTFLITYGNTSMYLTIPSLKMYGKPYRELYAVLKNYLFTKQSSIISKLKSISDRYLEVKLLGGGYYQGSMEEELNMFLGFKLTFDTSREYSDVFKPDLPDYKITANNYLDMIKKIARKTSLYSMLDDTTVNVDFSYDTDSTGFYTGASKPDTNIDYQPVIEVIYELDLKTVKEELASNYSMFLNIRDPAAVIDYFSKIVINDYFEQPPNVSVDIVDSDVDDNYKFAATYDKEDPQYAYYEIYNSINDIESYYKELIDPSNYPQLTALIEQQFQDERELSEIKNYFKKYMRGI